jgi:hypothetical protein
MKINLGFEDIPYASRYSAQSPLPASVKKRRPRRPFPSQQGYGAGKTTAQVATELEARYKIVETFYGLEEDNIAQDFEKSLGTSLESGMNGKSWDVNHDTSKLENKFRRNLSSRKYDGVIRGVPTKTSLRGVSHLRQNPYTLRASRPSFIDTSLYQRSFKAWLEP